MRSGRTPFLKIAFMLYGVTAFSCLHAADSAPAPASSAAAPEKIEFSRATSTAPKIPRPGIKTDDLLKNFGNVPEIGPSTPESTLPVAPPPMRPSKAAAEKMLLEWDKRKNWAVPGAQETTDPSEAFTKDKDKDKEDLLATDKPKGVMEKFLDGDNLKKNKDGQQRLRDWNQDGNGRDNSNDSPNDRNSRDKDDRDRRDGNEPAESGDLATFNLKNFIRQQNQPNFLNDTALPKASQMFRSEIGSGPDTRQLDRDKAQHEQRAAEFLQILKPRTSTTFVGANDPINSPDLSRREMNPITPRAIESSPMSRSPFTPPPSSPASRISDNNMFGVTGPAASSLSPGVEAPLPRPEPTRVQPIVIEAPKRPFN